MAMISAFLMPVCPARSRRSGLKHRTAGGTYWFIAGDEVARHDELQGQRVAKTRIAVAREQTAVG